MVRAKFGTSEQEYHLILDSASSDSWIMSEDCLTEACQLHALFGDGDSDSLEVGDTPFKMEYGTGSVSGTLAQDTIHLGPFSPQFTFGLASNASDEFKSFPMDGLLGIGRQANRHDTSHIMDVLVNDNYISKKQYGIHFSRHVDGTEDGEINFGEPNTERFDGDLNFIKCVDNDDGFWELPIEDAGVDGKMIGIKNKIAIMDTGTSFFIIPEEDAIAIHSAMGDFTQSGDSFIVPCDSQKIVQLKFGGQSYNISTADWIGGEVEDSPGRCKSHIIGRTTFGEERWLVGDVFLKNVYAVYDYDNSQMGLGVKGGNTNDDAQASGSSSLTATPTGGSSNGASGSNSSSPTGSNTSPTAVAEAAEPAQGGAGRLSMPSSSSPIAFMVAFTLLSLFI
ncbi:acid protease [Corynespora cassiicola Philippines]|uniref:Acid protease n=1 Tax=Corynespora cassiicola Philippines TaxID=1448308 RepID=A0A2T2NEX0_CORCC|nr:acid protease [Corynespora cassiicola Philippines]